MAFVANAAGVVGTCVETLTSEGETLPAGTITEGNFGLCHWFYISLQTGSATSNTNGTTLNGVTGTDWGETRYYTETEWGTAASGLTGSVVQTKGKAIGAAHGFALSHTSLTAFVPYTIYSMSWYQPKYAETYAATELRRYHGGGDGQDASKVRGYCAGAR